MFLKKSYVSRLMNVNQTNINKFVVNESRREIRQAQVSRINGVLLKGGHFQSPMVVNETTNGALRIIDGNHRFEAMKRFFRINPHAEIEVNLAVYRELTGEEEREVFKTWNAGIKQTYDDYVKIHVESIPIMKMIEREFPVTITHYSGFRFTGLFKAYLGIFRKGRDVMASSMTVEKFVEYISQLGKNDYLFLKRFCNNLRERTGNPGKDNIWFKSPLFVALMRLVFDNPEREAILWTKFDKIFYDPKLRDIAYTGTNRVLQSRAHEVMLNILNKGITKNLFIIADNNEKETQNA